MSPNDIRKLIGRYYDEVMNGNNLALVDQIFLPTATIHELNAPPVTGPEAIKQTIELYRRAFPDSKYTIEQIVVENNLAVTYWTAAGTHKGELFGLAPTNKFGTVTGFTMSRFEKDKVAESWVLWDVLTMLQNFGIELPIKIEKEVTV
jgi:predicted ester cyclase